MPNRVAISLYVKPEAANAAGGLAQLLDDRGADAGTAAGAVAGPVDSKKALEEVWQILRRNLISGVADGEEHLIPVARCGHLHQPRLSAVPCCVLEEVQ